MHASIVWALNGAMCKCLWAQKHTCMQHTHNPPPHTHTHNLKKNSLSLSAARNKSFALVTCVVKNLMYHQHKLIAFLKAVSFPRKSL